MKQFLFFLQNHPMFHTFVQFIKFCVVGVSNVLLCLVVYYLLVYMGVSPYLANTVGYFVGLINSFVWNILWVFRQRKITSLNIVKFFAVYLFSYFLTQLLLYVNIELLSIHKLIAPLINIVITTPINFLLNKYWTFNKRSEEHINMKKAVVTGANGFVGSALVRELVARGVSVLALDLPNNHGNIIKNAAVRFMGFELDKAMDVADIVVEKDYDVFYHFAWDSSAGPGRNDTQLQLDNAQWTVNCLHLSKALGCTRFVGAGSIMEEETWQSVKRQQNKPGLAYIYGAGKQVAHCMSKSIAADIGVDHVWGLITNAYGPGELSPRFINTTLRKIIHGEPLQFTAATQHYDFVYIDDVANAFFLLGEAGKAFSQYVIGSGNARPLREFILELQKTVAPDSDCLFGNIPFTGTDLPLSCFDTSATKDDVGFEPNVSFCEGVAKTIEWLRQQEENNG